MGTAVPGSVVAGRASGPSPQRVEIAGTAVGHSRSRVCVSIAQVVLKYHLECGFVLSGQVGDVPGSSSARNGSTAVTRYVTAREVCLDFTAFY